MHHLDELDRRLIGTLREDARIPVARLAGALGIARATAQARLDRLMDNGVVQGFTIRSPATASGLRAIMMIKIEGRVSPQVTRRLRGLPAITALHTTNGGWDLVAEIAVDDVAAFDRVLREIRQIEGVLNSQASILLSSC